MKRELTPAEWRKADAIARDLAVDVDRNELAKIICYFQRLKDKGKLLELLRRLPHSGYVRTGRTRGYLARIAGACETHLADVHDNDTALSILGWSFRLMTYHQTTSGRRFAQSRSARKRRPGP